MADNSIEKRLELLESRCFELNVSNSQTQDFISNFIYSAIISGKLSSNWVDHRIQETKEVFDKAFLDGNDPLSNAYQESASSDFLSQLTKEVAEARQLLSDLDLQSYID